MSYSTTVFAWLASVTSRWAAATSGNFCATTGLIQLVGKSRFSRKVGTSCRKTDKLLRRRLLCYLLCCRDRTVARSQRIEDSVTGTDRTRLCRCVTLFREAGKLCLVLRLCHREPGVDSFLGGVEALRCLRILKRRNGSRSGLVGQVIIAVDLVEVLQMSLSHLFYGRVSLLNHRVALRLPPDLALPQASLRSSPAPLASDLGCRPERASHSCADLPPRQGSPLILLGFGGRCRRHELFEIGWLETEIATADAVALE